MEKNNNAESVKLWARIGVSINVPTEVYQQLQDPEKMNEVMRSILKGQVGEVYLNGETYFPAIEENGKLAEVDFDFYDNSGKIAFISAKEPLQSFYYTFGTSDSFPYKKGWVEVQAADRKEADALFRKRFPDVHEGVLNCSSVYTKEQFMVVLKDTYAKVPSWKVCHEVISADPKTKSGIAISKNASQPKKALLSEKILDAQNRNNESASQLPGKEPERE